MVQQRAQLAEDQMLQGEQLELPEPQLLVQQQQEQQRLPAKQLALCDDSLRPLKSFRFCYYSNMLLNSNKIFNSCGFSLRQEQLAAVAASAARTERSTPYCYY